MTKRNITSPVRATIHFFPIEELANAKGTFKTVPDYLEARPRVRKRCLSCTPDCSQSRRRSLSPALAVRPIFAANAWGGGLIRQPSRRGLATQGPGFVFLGVHLGGCTSALAVAAPRGKP